MEQNISSLAEDALDATITAFTSITAETIKQHANIFYIHKNYKDNYIACYTDLIRELMAIHKIKYLQELQDFTIDAFISNIYQKGATAGQAKIEIIKGALKFLASLARLYKEISILAKQYQDGIPVIEELAIKNNELHKQNMQQWALQFPKAFQELMQRNHVIDIGTQITRIIRKKEQEKTRIIQPVSR